MKRRTYGFIETLEEHDLLVHGVHPGLQLHLIGISCNHVLKGIPAIPKSLPVQPRRQHTPQPGSPAWGNSHLFSLGGSWERGGRSKRPSPAPS